MTPTDEVSTLEEFSAFASQILQEKDRIYQGSLEEYLRSVLASVIAHRSDPPSYSLFATFLEEGFSATPEPYDGEWSVYDSPPENPWLVNLLAVRMFPEVYTPGRLAALESKRARMSAYDLFRDTLLFLITDLHSMTPEQLSDKWRYMGKKSPRGHDWYNWDPFTFLECALAGFTFHVEKGHLLGTDKETCNWAAMAEFFELGRVYE